MLSLSCWAFLQRFFVRCPPWGTIPCSKICHTRPVFINELAGLRCLFSYFIPVITRTFPQMQYIVAGNDQIMTMNLSETQKNVLSSNWSDMISWREVLYIFDSGIVSNPARGVSVSHCRRSAIRSCRTCRSSLRTCIWWNPMSMPQTSAT